MALLALVLVTAVWGVTFVQVKDAVEVYPLFALLAVRFAIATATLAPFAAGRIRTLDRRGLAAGFGLGGLLALGYALQTAGLARSTVSSTGFITGLCVVLTPVTALVLFRARIALSAWLAVVLGDLRMPHGSTVWGALLVTGVFASALAFLVQTWAQRRTSATRTALAFAAETVFAGFFGYLLAGDRLGTLGWGGCAVILAGIAVSEPAARRALAELVGRGRAFRFALPFRRRSEY